MNSITLDIFDQLPAEEITDFRTKNRVLFQNSKKTLVVIDDDPTGNQTVYGIPLLTEWDEGAIINEFKNNTPVFFLLTNSRSLTEEKSSKIYGEIAQNLEKASRKTDREFAVISRSDSTLRGHFASEIDAIKSNGNFQDAITVFIPVMFEGGRLTFNDVHYVLEGKNLIPVHETPFALDHSFGYSKSNLKQWIEEKTKGLVKAKEVYSMSVKDLRTQDVTSLSQYIKEIPSGSFGVFNALNYQDLDKISNGLLLAENLGKKIVYRTSSSFVPSYIGLATKPLLEAEDLVDKEINRGGLTIVGSYVSKSSSQLNLALNLFSQEARFELNVESILGKNVALYLDNIRQKIAHQLAQGNDVLLFTSRKLITGKTIDENIAIGKKVSQALISIVKELSIKPKYLIAKGGITSHDIAVKGLGMKRSLVLGQILPGIPVWIMGEETRFPELTYIVFPGNVGDENSLVTIIKKLK